MDWSPIGKNMESFQWWATTGSPVIGCWFTLFLAGNGLRLWPRTLDGLVPKAWATSWVHKSSCVDPFVGWLFWGHGLQGKFSSILVPPSRSSRSGSAKRWLRAMVWKVGLSKTESLPWPGGLHYEVIQDENSAIRASLCWVSEMSQPSSARGVQIRSIPCSPILFGRQCFKIRKVQSLRSVTRDPKSRQHILQEENPPKGCLTWFDPCRDPNMQNSSGWT